MTQSQAGDASGGVKTTVIRSNSQRYQALTASTVGMAFGYSNVAILSFGLFVVPLSAEFGWSRSEISLALGLLLWLVVVCGPVAGTMLDRFGVRRVLIPALILFALAFGSLSFVEGQLWLYYGIHVLLAVFGAGTLPASYTRVIVGWFDSSRGLALGITMAGVGLGGFVIPPLVQHLISRGGVSEAYLGVAIAILVIALPVVIFLLKEPPASRSQGRKSDDPLRGLLANRNYVKLATGFFLLGLFTAGMLGHLVALLVDRGVDRAYAAWTMSVLAIALTLGRVFAGFLLDRLSPPFVVAAFLAAPVLGLSMLAMGAAGESAMLCAVLLGLGIGAEHDFMCYLVSRYLPTESYARNYSMTYSAYAIGAGAGPILMSFSLERIGSYVPALWFLCGATVLAILVFLTLGDFRKVAGGIQAAKA